MLLRALVLLLGLFVAMPAPVAAQPFNVDAAGVALRGFDPVAYFVSGKAERGRADIVAMHDGATYRFASAANRDAFRAAPERYLPQYGGWCAYAAAGGKKADGDPEVWRIENGRLFLNYNRLVMLRWNLDMPGYISEADRRWPAIRDKSAAELQ